MILSCRRRRLSDPEEPAGAKGEWPGCERRFFSRVHGDAMHLSGDELIQPSMNRRRAGRRTGIAPTDSKRAI